MVPGDTERQHGDFHQNLAIDEQNEYHSESKMKNLIESMERYTKKIVKMELRRFDDYMEEKFKNHPKD